VVDGPGYLGLTHRVDQAIERDVLVAVAPGDDSTSAPRREREPSAENG
jgi:hypothetical protein